MILSAVVIALLSWCVLAVGLSIGLGALVARNTAAAQRANRTVPSASVNVGVSIRQLHAAA